MSAVPLCQDSRPERGHGVPDPEKSNLNALGDDRLVTHEALLADPLGQPACDSCSAAETEYEDRVPGAVIRRQILVCLFQNSVWLRYRESGRRLAIDRCCAPTANPDVVEGMLIRTARLVVQRTSPPGYAISVRC